MEKEPDETPAVLGVSSGVEADLRPETPSTEGVSPRAQEEMLKRMQQAAGGSAGGRQQTAAPSEEPEVRRGEAKTGIRRTTIIEDAVVVQEVRRRGPNDAKEQG